jgi:uncharacterized protein YfaS (alpha-2-macroglobulin family)
MLRPWMALRSALVRAWSHPWLLVLVLVVACVPTSQAPSVAPRGTLELGKLPTGAASDGPFRVVFAGPQGEIGAGTQLSIVFSRPLRALEVAGAEPAPDIRMKPALPGRWQWVGTSALSFVPESGRLPLATHVEVDVPAGLVALDGTRLTEPFHFEFTTPRPSLVSSSPSEGQTGLEPKQSFELRFNQVVSPRELERAARLFVAQAGRRRSVMFSVELPDASTPKRLVLRPKSPLPPGHEVTLVLAKDLRGAEGPLEAGQERTMRFETYGKLVVSDVHCDRDTPHGRCSPTSGLSLQLSNPVVLRDLKRALTIEPPLPITWETWRDDGDSAAYLDINAPFAAGQSYTLKVAGTLRDVYGQALGADVSRPIDIDDHWPRVEVGVSGDYFELVTRKAIPIASLNVSEYSLTAAPLTLDQVSAYYAELREPKNALHRLVRQKSVGARRVRPSSPVNVPAEERVDPAQVLAKTGGRGPMLLATEFAGRSGKEQRASILQVTDLAITAKLSRTGASLVWVTGLTSGAPVQGAEVLVAGLSQGKTSAPVVTDADGMATLPPGSLGPNPHESGSHTLIVAKLGTDWAFRRVSDYVGPWRSSVPMDLFGRPQSYGLLFTERGVYRPGDELQLKGILRRQAESGNEVLAGSKFTLVLRSPDWEIAQTHAITTNAFGTFAQSVRIPASAALGPWRLEIQELENESPGNASVSFDVAEYRPVEMEVKVSSDRPSYTQGEKARFEVSGDYLFGAPVSGAPTTYQATRIESQWTLPNAEGFVNDATLYDAGHPEKAPSGGVVTSGDSKLDSRGRFIQMVDLALPGQRSPELVSFSAEVTDVSRQTVASSSTAVVHPASFYVALGAIDPYFVEAPAKLVPRVVVATPEGVRTAGKSVRLELVRRRWTLARETSGGAARSEMRTEDTVVSSCSVTSTTSTAGCALTVTEAGYYLVLATLKDARGRTARAAVDAYVLGPGQSFWQDDDSWKVELVPDKRHYRPGDTARVLVKSPFNEAEAPVTVEADGVLEKKRVKLVGATPTVTIPISERMRPNAYVSVHLVKARSTPPPAAGGKTDLGAPTYRAGQAELRVDPEARRLKVVLTPNKRELRPGENIEVALEVKDARGVGTASEVTVYAVDEGVLSLVGYRTPDPLPVFTAPRPLRVATLESRDALARVAHDLTATLGLGADKGEAGGGGGADGARRDFRQSAYFNPTVMTGADGKARVSFRLPESLTTYRLMAVAATREDRYGYAETRVVTSKRLMARPALPRLLRAGDEASAGVIVSAKGFGPSRVTVTLDAKGVELGGPQAQTLDLPKDGSLEARFPLSAKSVGPATLRFHVTGQDRSSGRTEEDAVVVERRVVSPATLEAVALYGETERTAAERLGDFGAVRKDVGSLKVQVASTALVGVDAGMEQLLDYPYACTEQLSSRLLPLLPLRDLARDFGLTPPQNADALVEKTAAEILSRQRGDGGFGMWPESSESSPWVSAYALWTLHEAKQRGALVPKTALEQAQQYVRRELERGQEPWQRAAAAFELDVLAMIGAPDPGYMNTLYAQRAELPAFARAFLLHAMAISKQPKQDVDTLTRELENALRVEANRAFYAENLGDDYAVLMDSPARTTALVLRALLAARPDHPLGSRLARGLLSARESGTWRSTQETAFSLLALDAYRRAQEQAEPNFVAHLWLGGESLAEFTMKGRSATARSHEVPFARLRGGDLVFEKQGAGKLFYEARLRYARRELPRDTLDRGFFVQKTLRAVTPNELERALSASVPSQSAATLPAGSLVLADLVIVTPSPRNYAVIDDPLPAGLEAVDSSLQTSAAWTRVSGSAADDQPYPDQDEIAHGSAYLPSNYRRELRDDRALFFVDHLPAGVYHYRYLARATTVGRFVLPPTKAEEMYNPEVFGRTAASTLEVK